MTEKRVTYKTLSEWLAKGNGHVKERGVFSEESDVIDTHIDYIQLYENHEVPDNLTVRFFGTTKWLEPTASNLYPKKKRK
jgi:hypothetical protein